ncbi:MAG: 2-amino-4-hydroxy-6-hydroxymethyldihydropteridine diphosphokinase [Bacteroidia bacterium]|nr:2-amino-4-hydroxy-6-hydroxymethyldihydropteridine diphosphokinase [Bacteroidia bacterium]MDW8333069.1 2-amino-4-hydroxy-6-hydroxymethyldihydropteridine diphosphokinase [Bacteroidia bacterium]
MTDVFVGLGSNLGEREKFILTAASDLGAVELSPIYESDGWGVQNHPPYLNAVARLKTDSSPEHFLRIVHEIERLYGRQRVPGPPAPRPLDIDILTFGTSIRSSAPIVPHPRLHLRAFVLRPWLDLDPDFIVPLHCRSVRWLYDRLPENEKLSLRLLRT